MAVGRVRGVMRHAGKAAAAEGQVERDTPGGLKEGSQRGLTGSGHGHKAREDAAGGC